MRVLIIVSNILNPRDGPSTVAYNTLLGFKKIIPMLNSKNISITFISIDDKVPAQKETIIGENIQIIHTQRYPSITFTGEFQSILASSFLRKVDVAHVHSHIHELLPWIIRKTPTVYTMHGIFWKEYFYYPKVFYYIYKLRELRLRYYIQKISKFIAVSRYVIKELIVNKFNIEKVTLIENPVSDDFFNVKKNNKEEDEFIILYPAVISKLKNQLVFLKALKLLQIKGYNPKVYFIGDAIDYSYYMMVLEEIKKNNLNVKILGKIPYYKLLRYYSRASVVALTSLHESFGMVIAEALATGTPVIASNTASIPYLLSDKKTGFLVDPCNPRDIAEKLIVLLEDSKLINKMGKQGKKEAEKRFRSEIIVKQLLNLYENISH